MRLSVRVSVSVSVRKQAIIFVALGFSWGCFPQLLALSPSHPHTHTHTHTLSLSHPNSLTLSPPP